MGNEVSVKNQQSKIGEAHFHNGLPILLVVTATSFLGTFLISAVNIALPAIGSDFSFSAVGVSWIVTSFLLATALFMLPAGAWGDRYGSSRLFKMGLLLFMGGLTTLVYGSTLIPSLAGWILMSAALILLRFFWIHEKGTAHPLFEVSLFTHNQLFTYSSLSALINYTATFAIVFFLSLYLQKIQGLSPRDAGAVIITQPVMMTLFSPVVGRLSDRIEPRYFATAGMAICTTGLIMLALIGSQTPIWVIIVILAWVGLGFALFSSPNMNTIMGSVNHSHYGQASGLAASMRVFGQIISMSVVTLLFTLYFGNLTVEAVEESLFMTAMRIGFLIFALIGIPGIFFSYNRGNLREK